MTDDYLSMLDNPIRERVKALLKEDGECAERICSETVEEACESVDALYKVTFKLITDCDNALREICDAAEACVRTLHTNGGVFAKNNDAFSVVCVFLMRMEEKSATLAQAMLPSFSMQERVNECHVRVLSARSTLSAVLESADMRARADTYARPLNRLEERWERISQLLSRYCQSLFAFSANQLPEFMKKMQDCADFRGKGASCDVRQIRMLCEALQYAVRGIDKPCFD